MLVRRQGSSKGWLFRKAGREAEALGKWLPAGRQCLCCRSRLEGEHSKPRGL